MRKTTGILLRYVIDFDDCDCNALLLHILIYFRVANGETF